MMVYSCSLLPTKQVEVITKPLERTIVQPVLPREIDLKEPYWYVVSTKNLEDFLAQIEKDQGKVVFLAMSVPDYELMAYNTCLLYTSPSPRDATLSRMPSSA